MRRGGNLKRRKGLTRRSEGRQSYEAELDALTPALCARSRGICEICGSARAVVRHHRLRRSQGGRNEMANLLHLCCNCHTAVHANPAASYEMGWLIRRNRGL